ncbi:hypothetical protein ACHHYP_04203 [Achlya hypogyna]|uniref:ubiquitinyl hydrolase 1 n=1 Tax=Achlya hypogyna TaxID=1202772 RepID=A0A1V9Z201_ACHHY|nr:hypothetical protein ACHHYP_04203 [Achlya hypogyna]
MALERDEDAGMADDPMASDERSDAWRHKLRVRDSVDVRNVFGNWCAAMILQVTTSSVRVRFHNMNDKWDAWYPRHSLSLAPASTQATNDGLPFEPNQPIDLFLHDTWKEACVHRVRTDEVFVQLAGDTQQQRWVPFLPSWLAPQGVHTASPVADDPARRPSRPPMAGSSFDRYRRGLQDQQLQLVEVPGDGNCLFRAISHQLYGDDRFHAVVRAACMDYMEAEKTYFEPYVVGDMPAFLRYVAHKRQDAVWGDDPELQALSELYDRPLQVFVSDASTGAACLRTFHEASAGRGPPLRLSFYGGGHYDSIIPLGAHETLWEAPGAWEQARLAAVRSQAAEVQDTLERSRLEVSGRGTLEEAFAASVAAYEAHVAAAVEAEDVAAAAAASERDAVQASLEQSVAAESEAAQLQAALQASLGDDAQLQAALRASMDPYEEMLRQVLAQSAAAHDADADLQAALAQSWAAGI